MNTYFDGYQAGLNWATTHDNPYDGLDAIKGDLGCVYASVECLV